MSEHILLRWVPCRLGIGTPVDKEESLRLYTAAAEEPCSYMAAQRQLGVLYFEGMMVPQDFNEAVRWFQLATQQDDLEVICNLCPVNGSPLPLSHPLSQLPAEQKCFRDTI